MTGPVVIADEITATGYRLAGARALVPEDSSLSRIFDEACEESTVLLITAELAAQLPRGKLEQALLATRPLVVVIPDAGRRGPPPDIARALRAALGVEA
jgi:vacuolar-type H+-ATPase subunit F/Vma7